MNVFIITCAFIGGLFLAFGGLVLACRVFFVVSALILHVSEKCAKSWSEWKTSRTKLKLLQDQVKSQHLHIRALEDLLEEKRNEKTNAYR